MPSGPGRAARRISGRPEDGPPVTPIHLRRRRGPLQIRLRPRKSLLMNQSVRTYSFVYSRNDLGRIERANRNKNLTSRIDVTFLAIKCFGGRSRRDMFGHKMFEDVTSRRTTRSGQTGSDRPIWSTQTAGCGYRFGDAVGVVRSSLSTRLRLERDRPAQDRSSVRCSRRSTPGSTHHVSIGPRRTVVRT